MKQGWHLVILDESHRIKAPNGKASRFLARLRPTTLRRVAMTGTPMPHSPGDIYAQFRPLDNGDFIVTLLVLIAIVELVDNVDCDVQLLEVDTELCVDSVLVDELESSSTSSTVAGPRCRSERAGGRRRR